MCVVRVQNKSAERCRGLQSSTRRIVFQNKHADTHTNGHTHKCTHTDTYTHTHKWIHTHTLPVAPKRTSCNTGVPGVSESELKGSSMDSSPPAPRRLPLVGRASLAASVRAVLLRRTLREDAWRCAGCMAVCGVHGGVRDAHGVADVHTQKCVAAGAVLHVAHTAG